MALDNSSGGMYIKREDAAKSASPNICFVCGNVGHVEQYLLRANPNPHDNTEPFFPFLETHEPPNGYKFNSKPNTLVSCILFFKITSFLSNLILVFAFISLL